MPAISSIVVLEHSYERIACASSMFDLNLLLTRIKSFWHGFSVLFNKDSTLPFQSYTQHEPHFNIIYSSFCQIFLPLCLLVSLAGLSLSGGKIIVEMLFGNETDEINQIANVSVNLSDTRNLSSLNILPDTIIGIVKYHPDCKWPFS